MAQPESYGRITDEMLKVLEGRLGVEFEGPEPYIREATGDAIRHFAHGIGDTNPLWLDPTYAAKTRWGGIIAPPCILYAMDRIVSGYVGGLPGVHAMFAGTDWTWRRAIRQGDRIEATSALKALVPKASAFSRRAIQQIYHVRFRNHAGELVAEADSWCFRTEREVARERGKYKEIEPHRYPEEEMAAILADYARQETRGSTPRYWEDVQVGDEITPVVKGPLTITSVIAFVQGWGGLYLRAHSLAYEMFRRHPALGIPNAYGVLEPPERVHWDEEFARRVGAPGAYDYGPERISWLGHLMTNWIGDDGFLKQLRAEVRQFNIMGDTTWCRGRVVGKSVQGGEHVVECEIWAENQRKEVTAKGRAVAALLGKK